MRSRDSERCGQMMHAGLENYDDAAGGTPARACNLASGIESSLDGLADVDRKAAAAGRTRANSERRRHSNEQRPRVHFKKRLLNLCTAAAYVLASKAAQKRASNRFK